MQIRTSILSDTTRSADESTTSAVTHDEVKALQMQLLYIRGLLDFSARLAMSAVVLRIILSSLCWKKCCRRKKMVKIKGTRHRIRVPVTEKPRVVKTIFPLYRLLVETSPMPRMESASRAQTTTSNQTTREEEFALANHAVWASVVSTASRFQEQKQVTIHYHS